MDGMAIHLSEYSNSWIGDFMSLATRLVDALDGHGGQGIEHVGSTAVPGLVSRPIIDIAVIAAPLALAEASAAVEKLGYVRFSPVGSGGGTADGVGEPLTRDSSDLLVNSPGFVRFNAPHESVLHSLTVYEDTSALLHAHLAVRHTLMNNDALRDEFSGYKRGLAFTGAISIGEYRAAKVPMFQKILQAAGMSEAEAQRITGRY